MRRALLAFVGVTAFFALGLSQAHATLFTATAELKSLIESHGLSPNQYLNGDFENCPSKFPEDICHEMATTVVTTLAKHLSIGRVNPETVDPTIKIKQKNFSPSPQLIEALQRKDAASVLSELESSAPRSDVYQSLRMALLRLTKLRDTNQWELIANPQITIKEKTKHPVVVKIKTKLTQLGYSLSDSSDVVDGELVTAIKDLQQNDYQKPDGILSKRNRLWSSFFNQNLDVLIFRISLDLEKLRWLPSNWGNPHLFVNLANQSLRWYQADQPHQTLMVKKTINGRVDVKPKMSTPSLIDRITQIVLNPSWTSPTSVFVKFKLPKFKEWQKAGQLNLIDEYFTQKHFFLRDDYTGEELDPTQVDYLSIKSTKDLYFTLYQKPGPHAALGAVKFNLTNPYAIYIHDTDERTLFSSWDRLKSSGCVRVDEATDIAAALLAGSSWTPEKINATFAKPGEFLEFNQSTKINLRRAMPVYFLFLTSAHSLSKNPAIPSLTGVIRFFRDSYQQNNSLSKALKSNGYL
jgi:murein L,D-transpeptidase YcbB/YkuD